MNGLIKNEFKNIQFVSLTNGCLFEDHRAAIQLFFLFN